MNSSKLKTMIIISYVGGYITVGNIIDGDGNSDIWLIKTGPNQ